MAGYNANLIAKLKVIKMLSKTVAPTEINSLVDIPDFAYCGLRAYLCSWPKFP